MNFFRIFSILFVQILLSSFANGATNIKSVICETNSTKQTIVEIDAGTFRYTPESGEGEFGLTKFYGHKEMVGFSMTNLLITANAQGHDATRHMELTINLDRNTISLEQSEIDTFFAELKCDSIYLKY